MRARVLVTALVTALLGAFALASPAAAAPPTGQRITHCGQVFTGGAAYLAHDLTCATGFSFISTDDVAAGASLDLRGHRFRGKGSGIGFDVQGNAAAYASLSVVNGRVDHWGTAFRGFFGGVSLEKVKVDHNDLGLSCGKAACSIEDSVFSQNTVGTGTGDATLTVTRTRFTGNDTGMVVSCCGSGDVTATDSVFRSNRLGVRLSDHGFGEFRGNLFVKNRVGVVGAAADGGAADFDVTLIGNTFTRNRDGIFLHGGDDRIGTHSVGDNTAYKNSRYGIWAPWATDLGGNRARHNGRPCVGVVCSTN
jgi:Periplasmic copper-binding protein (NosD)